MQASWLLINILSIHRNEVEAFEASRNFLRIDKMHLNECFSSVEPNQVLINADKSSEEMEKLITVLVIWSATPLVTWDSLNSYLNWASLMAVISMMRIIPKPQDEQFWQGWGSKAYSMLKINFKLPLTLTRIEKLIKFRVCNQSKGMSGIFKNNFSAFFLYFNVQKPQKHEERLKNEIMERKSFFYSFWRIYLIINKQSCKLNSIISSILSSLML